MSEDIVQETIADIWQKRETIQIQQNFWSLHLQNLQKQGIKLYSDSKKIKVGEDEESLSDLFLHLTKSDESDRSWWIERKKYTKR